MNKTLLKIIQKIASKVFFVFTIRDKLKLKSIQLKKQKIRIEKQRIQIEKQRVKIEKQRIQIEKQKIPIRKQRVQIEKQRVQIEKQRVQIETAGKGNYLYRLIQGRYELVISPISLISSEYIDTSFSRIDTIVRYLAIEDYFGMNDFGFNLYKKMQSLRGATEGYEERFRNLIQNVNKNGYDFKSQLSITHDGFLVDGNHRLALSLYFDYPIITVKPLYSKRGPVYYSIDWFMENGFSESEIILIEEKRKKIFLEKGIFFPIILWPPLADYFDNIEKDIPYRIIKSKDFEYSEKCFESLFREIYKIDDIEKSKVDNMLTQINPCKKNIRVIWIEFPDPRYRKKRHNHPLISQESEELKLMLRKKYKDKVSSNVQDIIFHITYNWVNNIEIMEILRSYDNNNLD